MTFKNKKQAVLKSLMMSAAMGLSLTACSEQPTAETGKDSQSQTAAKTAAKPELGSFGIDLTARNDQVNPGENFFQYANGTWLDSFEIPADRTNFGAFTVLAVRSEERIKAIIDDIAAMDDVKPGSAEQKIRDYYNSYMDTAAVEARGLDPIKPLLADIDAISNKADLIKAFGRAGIDGTTSPITFGIGTNRQNPNEYMMNISMGGINLGDRDYYLLDTERLVKIREAYVAHIAEVLGMAGIEDAETKAKSILALETKMAEIQWTRTDRRNRSKTLNPSTLATVIADNPGYDFKAHLDAGGYPAFDQLNIVYPDTVTKLIALVDDTDITVWKAYLTYEALNNHASLLTADLDDASFRFYSQTLRGAKEQRARWKRAVSRVGGRGSLGMELGQVYVARHFTQEAKDEMDTLVENLRTALGQRIDNLDWMGDATKAKAREKLAAFRPKVGYPDVWRLSTAEIKAGNLFENAIAIRTANRKRGFEDFGKPTDRERWGMTPQTVNAYYNSAFNEIVFPAAILQPPFFDLAADPAVNYGGIGAVIGHEMGHGFDDQGSKSDAKGIQVNWWTEEDRANFERFADTLVEQYNGYEALPGGFVDGRFTLGENIGDVGGLSMAYHAYKLSLGGKEAPVIDGLTGDQRFFLAWAQVWKRKYRDGALRQRLKSDTHSPSEFRVNGVVRNMDAWYDAFSISKDDPLYLPQDQRVTIW